ncbi:MAG: LysR family transcriptional regulator, partial [Pseudomonadota bacterium]
MINWDDYRYLLAMEQTGSLSAAARHLGVSQPTVSRRITELERTLGVGLVQRLPDGYQLSAIGEKVCERARVIQQKAEEIRHAVIDDRDQSQHQVVVSAPEGIAAALVTPALRDLHVARPDLVVEVTISTRPVDLRRREADIAVRMGDPRDDTLIGRKVGAVEFGLFAPGALIERLGLPSSEGDLQRYPFIESAGAISHLPQANWLRLAIPPRMKT